MKTKFEWVQIKGTKTFRAKVIGGWLVCTPSMKSVVFVPDEKYQWEVEQNE